MLRHIALILALAVPAATLAPQAHAQMDARDMEVCRSECMARARDASDPRYRSCVATRCHGEPARRTTTAPRRTTTAAPPAPPKVEGWALNTHPALGVSLHVQTEQGVLGLACAPGGLAIRATNGLFRGPSLGWLTDTGSAGGAIALSPGAAYSETADSACAIGAAGLGSAVSVVLVDTPVTARGPGMGYSLAVPGGEVPVMSGSEVLARFPGAWVVPAQGLAAGLGALSAGCPALAEALRSPCP